MTKAWYDVLGYDGVRSTCRCKLVGFEAGWLPYPDHPSRMAV